MKAVYLFGIICSLIISSCSQIREQKENNNATEEHKYTNQLVQESSPYLLQHAHNPVNWYPWGKEALAKAKKENKLILVSIGYAACHWCHVMEHESFEDEEVAKYMNEHFVCIKVDREERPDVDQIYMNAVQLLTGSGGWPLNCIALPDGRPIYGGTYYPKDKWMDLLQKLLAFVKDKPEEAEQQAKALQEGIVASDQIVENTEEAAFSIDDLNAVFSNWKGNIDYVNGGHNRAPKFPLPVGYQFLLHYHYLSKNKDALKAVTTTLDKMADGGIYDQIGGGFARYSTDNTWKVPHFEKMLYDNAQLVSLYSTAYQQTKNPKYKQVVKETLEFIDRELTSKEGGFYSSLDADSEGEEGKFYVWTKTELEEVLGEKATPIIDYYNIKEKGNWEQGHNILFHSDNGKKIAEKHKLSIAELEQQVLDAKPKLLKARVKRIRPGLDDKVLTSWNALMLKAYVDAYRVFDDKKYLDKALQNAMFLKTKMKLADNRLNRNYKNGKASINAFLDDYAFTIAAFISVYQATFDEQWLNIAKDLMTYTLEHFYDESSGMFYYTSDIDEALIARKMELSDNVIPASNSEMAKNLYVLGQYFYNNDYIQKSKKMLNNVKANTLEGAVYYANWDILMAWFSNQTYEVAIVGKDFESKRKEFDQHYLPNVLLYGGKTEGSLSALEYKLISNQTTIYVCQNQACKAPTTEVNVALKEVMK
ncbi:MAG: thioredoxin domain-containing protein [Aureispira sp.]|nr:thioredoxin domain-containing protein [Aureispira sp.]